MKKADPYVAYSEALSVLKPKQRAVVELYLNDPETAGNMSASAVKADYAQATRKNLSALVPKNPSLEVDFESLHPVTVALLLGMRVKAEALRKVEEKKNDQRVRLGISPDYVLRRLKEIAERAAGYDFDKDTGERTGSFDAKKFQPSAAQRTFELIGREAGMFYDRGPAAPAKTFDQMTEEELDKELAAMDARMIELEGQAEPSAPKAKAAKKK